MKKTVKSALMLALALSITLPSLALTACNADNSSVSSLMSDITYTSVGYEGQFPVLVSMNFNDDKSINDMNILFLNKEDYNKLENGANQLQKLKNSVMSANSSDFVMLSDNLLLSEAVKVAVENIFKEAFEGVKKPIITKENATFNAGTYKTSAKGHNDTINLEVTFDDNNIIDIKVLENNETEVIEKQAAENIIDDLLKTGNINAISGATNTSFAVMNAIKKAIVLAGADPEKVLSSDKNVILPNFSDDADVIVIGAGGAGLTAAIKASDNGAKVTLLEKNKIAGGNTSYSTAGLNAANSHYQKELGIADSIETFVSDTLKAGHYKNDEDLVKTLAKNSSAAIDWLDSLNIRLSKLSFTGGASVKRCHAPESGSAIGSYLVSSLLDECEGKNIDIIYNSEVTSILSDENGVTGVTVKDEKNDEITLNAKAIVIATGGFGANFDMIKEYRPDLANLITTNSSTATGDGIKMATAIGASTVDLGEIQVHPTVIRETGALITESVRGNGAILVNHSGNRFVNEMETRDVVSSAMQSQVNSEAFLIFDKSVKNKLSVIDSYIKKGYTISANSVDELASKIKVNSENLKGTIASYNAGVQKGNDAQFARSSALSELTTAPFYAIKVTVGIHNTLGGLRINSDAQVLNAKNQAINGLFAAGEVTGGVHGDNRIGGNAVTDVIVFGTIAGENAAKYALENAK